MQDILDLYTDYLLSSFGQATATGLSHALDGVVSHDKITRHLSENHRLPKMNSCRSMIGQCIKNQLKVKWIITNSWFASSDKMLFIHRKKKNFLIDIKTNRLVARSQKDRSAGK